MQLGMIGLGRMGSYMVQRLMKAGHECVVYDTHPQAMQDLVSKGAKSAPTLGEFVQKLTEAARAVAHGAGCGSRSGSDLAQTAAGGRRHHHRWRQFLLSRRHSPGRAS